VCGRYGLSVSRVRFDERFPFVDFPLTVTPRYNIAPTQDVLAIRNAGDGARAELVRWGIELPAAEGGRSLINVRSETALGRGFFRKLLEDDRVLLPASHFYEWTGYGPARRPLLLTPRDGLVAFAGLRGRWTDPRTGRSVPAVTILTCPPNDLIRPFHDRMPVILDPAGWEAWLDPHTAVDHLARLLVPCPADALRTRPASRLVNDPQHDGPELLEPPRDTEPEQLPLLDVPPGS
jgi:putative SOS response-associated peptidase YedK